MKTLILYASKTGVTKDCANELAKTLRSEIDIVDINDLEGYKIDQYDAVILGSYIHAGMINGKIKKFSLKNEDVLITKKVGFFVCGTSEEHEALGSLDRALSPKLKEYIKVRGFFGGEFRSEKLGFFSRWIVKQVLKDTKLEFKIKYEKIDAFAVEMNKELKSK